MLGNIEPIDNISSNFLANILENCLPEIKVINRALLVSHEDVEAE